MARMKQTSYAQGESRLLDRPNQRGRIGPMKATKRPQVSADELRGVRALRGENGPTVRSRASDDVDGSGRGSPGVAGPYGP